MLFKRFKIKPYLEEWDESGTMPIREIYLKMGKAGILAAQMFPGPHLKDFVLPNNLPHDQFDYFYEMIAH